MSKVTCRICLKPENPDNCLSISPENESSTDLLEMLIYCIPEMDIHLVLNPVICKSCTKTLTEAFTFKKQCLRNEEKLLKYSEKYALGAKVDLNLYISTKPLVKSYEMGGRTNNNDNLLVLTKIVHKNYEKRFDCKNCIGCFLKKKNPKEHAKVVPDNFTCYVCSRTFDDISQIRKHIYVHSPKYTCKICGKQIRDQGQMRVHLRVHTGEKPFECKYCGKRYKQSFSLSDHMHQHQENAEKNRCKCEICGRVLSTKFNLQIHMKQHTEVKPKPLKQKRTRKRKSKLEKSQQEMQKVMTIEQVLLEEQYKVLEDETTCDIKQEFAINPDEIKMELEEYKSSIQLEMMSECSTIKHEQSIENPNFSGTPNNELLNVVPKVEENFVTEVQYLEHNI